MTTFMDGGTAVLAIPSSSLLSQLRKDTGHIGLLCLSGAQANYSFGATPGARCTSVVRPCKKPLLALHRQHGAGGEAGASADAKGVAGAGVQRGALPRRLRLCYPRHHATEPRISAGCRRRRNGDVIARVSAAVRAALSRPPSSASARQGEAAAAALRRSLSTTLRVVGFWKKRSGDVEEMDRHRPVASCSATAASSGRRDGGASSPAATSPRRVGRDSRQAGGDRVGLSGRRRRHPSDPTLVEGCECEATCHLDEERRQEQRLSPVSVMDFQSQDGGDDDCNDSGGCDDGHSDDEGTSPTFERSLANIRSEVQMLVVVEQIWDGSWCIAIGCSNLSHICRCKRSLGRKKIHFLLLWTR